MGLNTPTSWICRSSARSSPNRSRASSAVGNEPARIVEVRAGMLNAIGLANVGLDRFLKEKVPQIRKMPCPVIVNVAGHSFDDYVETCGAMNELDCIAAVELNVSCPNVKDGLTFGTHPGRLQGNHLPGEKSARRQAADREALAKRRRRDADGTRRHRRRGADALAGEHLHGDDDRHP